MRHMLVFAGNLMRGTEAYIIASIPMSFTAFMVHCFEMFYCFILTCKSLAQLCMLLPQLFLSDDQTRLR